MRVTQLNHVGLHVHDLTASRRFYGEVLGLKEIARPELGFPGAWYGLGDGQEVHLIARAPKEAPYTVPRERHVAFAVASVEETVATLRRYGVDHDAPVRRPDGAVQIFLRDPDQHVVELCCFAS